MSYQPRAHDPTEDEIAAACAGIRKTWSDDEYQRRSSATSGDYHAARPDIRVQRWRPPMINLTLHRSGHVVE